MPPSKPLFRFIFLGLAFVNASSTHSGTIKMSLDLTLVEDPYKNWLANRDGSVTMLKEGSLYITSILASNSVEYHVAVDTGSSYTWVGANSKNPYFPLGPSSQPTGQTIELDYATAKFEGNGYTDDITLETSEGFLTVNSQAVGAATFVRGLPERLDGILGLGRNIVIGPNGNSLPTIVDNLYSQGTIRYAVLGVYLVPLNDGGIGELTFGDYNDGLITSDVNYVPITRDSPANEYWGVDGSLMYGGTTVLKPTSGIVDTGTNTISIASDAFMAYQLATGATQTARRRLIITPNQYRNLQTLSFLIGGQSYDLSPNAQISPRSRRTSQIILVVKDVGSGSGSGMDFLLGYPFIQRYYIVLNSTSSQIGFASTHYTSSTSN
ncbi:hypothetical protein ID866_6515 [Astraeus odoratus]|nr:hypothetical protein ID866_6515 [Astraeus odoratus]